MRMTVTVVALTEAEAMARAEGAVRRAAEVEGRTVEPRAIGARVSSKPNAAGVAAGVATFEVEVEA